MLADNSCDKGMLCAKNPTILNHKLTIQIPVVMNRYFFLSLIHIWQVIKLITEQVGGVRISPPELGTYMGENGYLMMDVNVWISFYIADNDFDKYRAWTIDLACHTRTKLRQEAIALVIDNTMSFY